MNLIKESADLYFKNHLLKRHWDKNVIECGRHSGIPDCCIINYISNELDKNENYILLENLFKEKFGINYRACISCILQGRREILKLCNCFRAEPNCVDKNYWFCATFNCGEVVEIHNSICEKCQVEGSNK